MHFASKRGLAMDLSSQYGTTTDSVDPIVNPQHVTSLASPAQISLRMHFNMIIEIRHHVCIPAALSALNIRNMNTDRTQQRHLLENIDKTPHANLLT